MSSLTQEETLCLCPRVCSHRWSPEGKAFIHLLVFVGSAWGFGSFLVWFYDHLFFIFMPDQTQYVTQNCDTAVAITFSSSTLAVRQGTPHQSKSFRHRLCLIILYKVWRVVGYPLTAPAPNIAQTALTHLGSAATPQCRPTQFNSRNPSAAKSKRKIPCARAFSAHQPLGHCLKPL